MDPKDAPFSYGDGTLMQLKEQTWQFDELGTQVIGGQPVTVAAEAAPLATLPIAPHSDDPLVRIERQLEELTRAVTAMQRRLDSIDAAIARVVARA